MSLLQRKGSRKFIVMKLVTFEVCPTLRFIWFGRYNFFQHSFISFTQDGADCWMFKKSLVHKTQILWREKYT